MPKTEKSTLHRDVWLRKALDVLFSNGINNVKVEILARELDVTKGSFYWHFKNRGELLEQMVDWWRETQKSFIGKLDVTHIVDAPAVIRSVIDFTQHTDDARHDVAMREFARFDEYAASAVSEIDRLRLDYLTALFEAAGFHKTDALLRAQILYFYQVGDYTTDIDLPESVREELADRHYRLLLSTLD